MAVIIPINVVQTNNESTIGIEEETQKQSIKQGGYGGQIQTSSSGLSKGAAVAGAIGYHAAQNVFQTVISNVGTYTGDSHLQTQVNEGVKIAGKAIAFGGAIATGNYAMAAMMVANEALSIGTTIMNEQLRLKQEMRILSVQRSRNGYTDEASIIYSRRH